MKFLKLDGSIGELTQNFGDFEAFLQVVGEEKCYVLPPLPENSPLSEVIIHTMKIISMRPPYIPESEIHWILAYMEGLISFSIRNQENRSHYSDVEGYILEGVFEPDLDNNINTPNFIEITRKFTAIDLIIAHAYGKRFHSRRDSDGNPEHRISPKIVGFLDSLNRSYESHERLDRHCLDFMGDRSFKTQMTRRIFKGSCGVFKIPDGMRFNFYSRRGVESLEASTIAPFEVDRFFGTLGGWVDDYKYVGFPELVDKNSISNIEFMPKIRSTLGRQLFPDQAPVLEIPLSWITHVVEASRFPTIDEIKVFNVCNHSYPSVVDKSLNERIKTVIYEQGVAAIEKMSDEFYRR